MNVIVLGASRTQPVRTAALALAIAIFAFGALGLSHPRTVHATLTSAYIVSYCFWAGPPNHPDKIYVEGWNQNNQYVRHQFPAYYTYDYPNYWWWAINSYVYYKATKNGYTDSLRSFLVYGPDGTTDFLGANVC